LKKIFAVMAFVAMAGMIIAIPSYAEYQDANPDQRVFEGKVVTVDTGKSTLTVDGGVKIDFAIPSDAVLQKYDSDVGPSDIELSDVDVGDYVTVEYYRSGPGESRVPDKVTKVIVDSSKSGW
jgi:hypothetical protein